ncbi:hypothetical protein P7K49_027346 [Saguinus oedipus]|uniref:Uncharacterized protein n=1 Tax=Saguinus oedipus TaxID=9490 RepID=A0ABQ9UAE6_SAGOE|nr:hypothetical protein P7K49_027346 [Saguinus oedipus]
MLMPTIPATRGLKRRLGEACLVRVAMTRQSPDSGPSFELKESGPDLERPTAGSASSSVEALLKEESHAVCKPLHTQKPREAAFATSAGPDGGDSRRRAGRTNGR